MRDLIAMALFAAAGILSAEEPVYTTQQVDKMVENLGAEYHGARDQALRQLETALTPALLKDLQKRIPLQSDVEIQLRLRRIVGRGPAYFIEQKLDPLTRQRFPMIGYWAVSSRPEDLRDAARAVAGIDEQGASTDKGIRSLADRELLAETVLRSLKPLPDDLTEQSFDLRLALIRMLGAKDMTLNTERGALLAPLTHAEEPEIRKEALMALLRHKPSHELENLALKSLGDMETNEYDEQEQENPFTRAGIIRLLAEEGVTLRLSQIADLVRADGSVENRASWFAYLEAIYPRDPKAVEIVVESLTFENSITEALPAVRTLARWGLADTYADKIKPLLEAPGTYNQELVREALAQKP